MEISTVQVSSKRKVLVPDNLLKKMHAKKGEKLLAYGNSDTIVLKKISSSSQEFEKISAFGKRFARKKGIKKAEVLVDD